jgi:hypothetical protein
MVDASRSQATRNQLWLNPVIGSFSTVAANFVFHGTVYQLYSAWFLALVTILGCVLLMLGAIAAKRTAVLRAPIACYEIVIAGIAMAVSGSAGSRGAAHPKWCGTPRFGTK